MARPGSGLYPSVELGENYSTGENPVNTNLRRKAFSNSPLFNEYSISALVTLANQILNSKSEKVIGNKFFPEFDLNYKIATGAGNVPAPDIEKVITGGAGLPGTPFTPNIASPGQENGVSPEGLPDIGLKVEDLNSFRKTPVVPGQTQGTANPSKSKVGVQVGDELNFGKSTGTNNN